MKEFLMSHGFQAVMLLVVVCYNIIGTAIVAVLGKIEVFLTPAGQDPNVANPGINKVQEFFAKTAGWAAKIGDWLLGNKEH